MLTIRAAAAAAPTAASAPAAAGRGFGLTNGAALSFGDDHLLTVGQLFALDVVAEDLAVVAHAESAWRRLPDVLVGVHLAVCRAAAIAS